MHTDLQFAELKSILKFMYQDYPDVVNIDQLCLMLGDISKKTAYKLLQAGRIGHFRIGKIYKIPKIHIIEYLAISIGNKKTSNFNALLH
ncbi:helix-turn-helix domain-containing protein [Paenibacillus segetis]|uniref:Helix-turn-helix domain-containing protein n=1 Tax=Paenibacillus segetis TaxID=1325360 RepID=A0ABQ1YQW7_9BACL|nr:helix-turn-helix domain-containing protein [Paenibacillus segetis]GGH35360.1 hypothetical protein GCM10008013_41620 [Paenibacillus segetis]